MELLNAANGASHEYGYRFCITQDFPPDWESFWLYKNTAFISYSFHDLPADRMVVISLLHNHVILNYSQDYVPKLSWELHDFANMTND